MTALVVALLLASQPGLLPRKPPSAESGASKGPVITPGQIPDGPVAPPVILDDAQPAPPPPAPAPRQPPPAPAAGGEAAAPASPAPVPAPATPAPTTARPATRPSETGQWVYTQQYGWLWMAHGDAYWYAPPTGRGQPYAYVLRPDHGWTWVEAPWVWGLGPWPHFGASGPTRFGWYIAGYWRTPWRWKYWPGRDRGRPARPGA